MRRKRINPLVILLLIILAAFVANPTEPTEPRESNPPQQARQAPDPSGKTASPPASGPAQEANLLPKPEAQPQTPPVQKPSTPSKNTSKEQLLGPYLVKRVVDGDTLVVDLAGKEERVRLIGIDTPESVHPNEEENVPYGKIASDFTKALVLEKQVHLELDLQERDKYGRLLAYVYLDGVMLNKTLLQAGHAKVSTYPPNIKYVKEFTALQASAREEKKGLWSY